MVDDRGRVVCVDDQGRPAPLDRCVAIRVGEDPHATKVVVRKSCQYGAGFEEKIKKRLVQGKGTLWAFVDDPEDEDEDHDKSRKKGRG